MTGSFTYSKLFIKHPCFSVLHIYKTHTHTHMHTHIHFYVTAPGDYTSTAQRISFGPSSVVNVQVPVPVSITADDLLENDETFSASLTLVPSSLIVVVVPSFATVTIQDDDRKYLHG